MTHSSIHSAPVRPVLAPQARATAGEAASKKPAPAIAADVRVKVRDIDGFNDRSASDMQATLDGTVSVTSDFVIHQIKQAIPPRKDLVIDRVAFDPQRRAYVIEGKARVPVLPDPTFRVQVHPDPQGRLVIQANSWADKLARLVRRPDTTGMIEEQLKRQGVAAQREGDRLIVDPAMGFKLPATKKAAPLDVPAKPGSVALAMDSSGRLTLTLRQLDAQTGTQPKGATPKDAAPDEADMHVRLQATEALDAKWQLNGQVVSRLDRDELGRVLKPGSPLDEVIDSAEGTVTGLEAAGTFKPGGELHAEATGDFELNSGRGVGLKGPFEGKAHGKAWEVRADDIRVQLPVAGKLPVAQGQARLGPDGFTLEVNADLPDPSLEPVQRVAGAFGERLGSLFG